MIMTENESSLTGADTLWFRYFNCV